MVIVAVVCLVVALVIVVPIARLVGQVDRISGAFDGLEDRPTESGPAKDSLDVLVVGVDGSGESGATTWPGKRQPMSLMVMHFDADRLGATVVGIPLDVEAEVPGHGVREVGSVPALGGPPLLVATVEGLTGFRMDHLAVLDWHAFETLVDRMGGIDLSAGGGGAFSGSYRMQVNGQDALKLVSPQPGLETVALLRRQLVLIDVVVGGSLHQEMHRSPLLVYNFLDAVTQNLAVDEEWSVASMARMFLSLWSLRSGDIVYVTVPVTCDRVRDKCRARLDEKAAPEFWSAVERDRIDAWLSENDKRGLVDATR